MVIHEQHPLIFSLPQWARYATSMTGSPMTTQLVG
jgi:hypothetical protein